MATIESVLGVAVGVLAISMIIVWIVRITVSERAGVAAATERSGVALARNGRVRQLDHALVEIGLAFLVAVVGYVILGVMPA